jgi:hypothetical protein
MTTSFTNTNYQMILFPWCEYTVDTVSSTTAYCLSLVVSCLGEKPANKLRQYICPVQQSALCLVVVGGC